MQPRCAVCGEIYDERRNVGAWECGQHLEPVDPRTGAHPCCGARSWKPPHVRARGCVPADHNPIAAPWSRRHDARISAAPSPRTRKEAIVETGEGGYFRETRVRRFADPLLGIYSKRPDKQ